jgi:predicted RNase H-like nuclease (RuvC/YqgF family)
LANTAKDLRYDNQVREGHLDVIRDTAKERDNLKTEIERLKEENSALENSLVEQDFEIERLKGIIRRMLQYEFYCGFLGYVERSAGGGET